MRSQTGVWERAKPAGMTELQTVQIVIPECSCEMLCEKRLSVMEIHPGGGEQLLWQINYTSMARVKNVQTISSR